MATVSETGWPMSSIVAARQGSSSCLTIRTLGFADYRGNKQYVSIGNLTRRTTGCRCS